MEVRADVAVTIIGTFVVWAGTTFGYGKAYGVLKTRVKAVEEDNRVLRENIEKVLKCFVTADGEPRLVSFTALDKVRTACREGVDQRISIHDKAIEKHDEKLDKILEGIADLSNGG